VDGIAPDLAWDLPLRLLGGLHYLVLAGETSWQEIDRALDDHADFLRRWLREQSVQTNEVQRAWGLLPVFLSVADGRPFDLLELGPSAGLNLVWDHYRYVYSTGVWGDEGPLELLGEDRVPPPGDLLHRRVAVARRRGIDLNPVDVTTEDGARLLEAFVWADQTVRLERLRRAIAVLRHDPPELIKGNYVDDLPALLRDRAPGAHLVVFQTASTMYLEADDAERLRAALHHAAREEPLTYISTGHAPNDNGFALEVERYPDGRPTRVAVMDFHGDWLEWGR
jgi:hypothetical protein